MNTLSVGATTITLDPALMWQDEHNWVPVGLAQRRSITGALILHTSARTGGQPITLAGPRDDGWMRRADVAQCMAWAAVPGQVMTLVYRGSTFSVMWRANETAIDARPLQPLTTDDPDDEHIVTLRLMKV